MSSDTAGGQAARAVAAGSRRAGLAAVLRAVVSARTWLAVVHLTAGFWAGLVTFTVLLTGLATGIALVPVFLAGLPVLAGTLWLSLWIARAERARYALLLGTDIPAVPSPRGRTWLRTAAAPLRSGAAWRATVYGLVRFPLSALQLTLVTTVWSLGLVLVTAPCYYWALPGGGAHLGGHLIRYPGALIAAAAAGLALLLVSPGATCLLAAGDAAFGRALLGSGREELTARIGALEASRAKVIDAAEAERMRIERDLHDGAQQRLVSLAMELGRAKAKFPADPEAAAAIVGQAHEQAKEALAELRNLVRGVHPPVLSDRGLDAALSGLAALSPVPVTVSVDLPARPPAAIEAIAYFVVAEALTNVAKAHRGGPGRPGQLSGASGRAGARQHRQPLRRAGGRARHRGGGRRAPADGNGALLADPVHGDLASHPVRGGRVAAVPLSDRGVLLQPPGCAARGQAGTHLHRLRQHPNRAAGREPHHPDRIRGRHRGRAPGPRVTVQTGSGNIGIAGLASAHVSAASGSGDITLTFTRVPAHVRVSASSGNVTLVLPPGRTLYAVSASTDSGNRTVHVPTSSVSTHVITVTDGSGDISITN